MNNGFNIDKAEIDNIFRIYQQRKKQSRHLMRMTTPPENARSILRELHPFGQTPFQFHFPITGKSIFVIR